MIWLAVFTLHFEIICLEKVKAHISDFEMLLHCTENLCCINITNHKGFLIRFNLLLLFFWFVFSFLVQLRKPSPAQSVALSRFLFLCVSVCPSLSLSLSRSLLVRSLSERWHWETAVTWDASRSWQGLRKAEAEGRERAFIWDWGRWPPSFPFFFSPPFLSPSLRLLAYSILPPPTEAETALKKKRNEKTFSAHSKKKKTWWMKWCVLFLFTPFKAVCCFLNC